MCNLINTNTHTHTHTRGLCSTEQDSTGNTTMVHFFSCGRESPTSPLRRAPETLSPGRRRSPLPRQPPPLQTPLPLTPERDRRSAAGSSGNKCSPGSRALLASPTFVLPLRLDSTSLQPSLSPRVLARARYFFFVVHVSRGTTNSASSRLLLWFQQPQGPSSTLSGGRLPPSKNGPPEQSRLPIRWQNICPS